MRLTALFCFCPRALRRSGALLSVLLTVHMGAMAQRGIPDTNTTALDGHNVVLPRDLSPATVVIVGFTRASADATTAWEIPVRTKLAAGPVGVYDVAVLASVPGVLHGWVVRSLRSKVPDSLKGHFLPVFADEAGWKKVSEYVPNAQDAAYVMLVNRSGQVLWRTHEPYSAERWAELYAAVKLTALPPTP